MLYIKRNAFTMIELVFVIVVLGILAAVAIPKLAATRTDAEVTKGKSDVSAIRSAIISERQTRIIKGDTNFINRLDAGVGSNTDNVTIFDSNETLSATSPKLLQYGIKTKTNSSGHWVKSASNQYTYTFGSNSVAFTYYPTDTTVGGVFHPAGTFDCDHSDSNCNLLTQ